MNSNGPALNAHDNSGRTLLLTVADVAALLGVSPRSVWRMVQTGECPAPLRLRGCTRWRRAEVERWIAAGCPAAAIRRDAASNE